MNVIKCLIVLLVLPLASCSTAGRSRTPEYPNSGFESSVKVRNALGVVPQQQLMQGGKLYESYRVGDEMVQVTYEHARTGQ